MKKLMLIFSLVFLLAFGFAGTARAQGWQYVQDTLTTATPCTGGAINCTIAVNNGNMIPTTPGSIWIVTASTPNNATIASVTGGGGNWTLCPASSCHMYDATLGRNVDAAYNLTGAGNTQAITVTLNTNSTTFFKVTMIEIMPPAGATASFESAGAVSSASCTSSCPGVGLTVTGTDVIYQFQGIHDPAGWNAWSAPYITTTQGGGMCLNCTSGAAPTVKMTQPGSIINALAFKSSKGIFTPPAQPISIVNFTNPQGLQCNLTCSLTIPATGSGHLLYIEAANITTNRITAVSGGGTWVIPSGSNSCQITMSGGFSLSCAYLLSSSPGATTVNVTMSGNSNNYFAIVEAATTSGAFSFDTQASQSNSPSNDPAGPALTPTGNDIILQSAFVPGGASCDSVEPLLYIQGNGNEFFLNQASIAAAVNTNVGTAPRWCNEQNNATIASGVAFKTGAGPQLPAPPTSLSAIVN